jgi:DNA ligase (NAD+)
MGDTVIVQKAGDIIPKVVEVLKDLRKDNSKKYIFPKKVEGCGGDGSIEKKEGEVAYRCVFLNSKELKVRRISYFVSKKAFDISEIGPKNIEFFLEKKIISEPADIFKLRVCDIENFFGFGKKSAENIVDSINKKKKIGLVRFLIALGIDEVGEESALLLAQNFIDFEKVMGGKSEDFSEINGIGEVMAKKIVDFFADEKNKKEIENLLRVVGVQSFSRGLTKKGYFTDKKVLITGTFENFSRDELKEKIREMGGKNLSSISKSTDILIAGESAGSKLQKAKDLGVEIIDEKKVLEVIK